MQNKAKYKVVLVNVKNQTNNWFVCLKDQYGETLLCSGNFQERKPDAVKLAKKVRGLLRDYKGGRDGVQNVQ